MRKKTRFILITGIKSREKPALSQEIKSPENEVDVHIFNFSIAKTFHQFPLYIVFFRFWYRGYFTDGPKMAPPQPK